MKSFLVLSFAFVLFFSFKNFTIIKELKAQRHYLPTTVIFHEHAHAGGKRTIRKGTPSSRNIGGAWNDKVSSLWVRRGYEITLYEHEKYRGRSIRLSGTGRVNGHPVRSGFRYVSIRTPYGPADGTLYLNLSYPEFRFNDILTSYSIRNAWIQPRPKPRPRRRPHPGPHPGRRRGFFLNNNTTTQTNLDIDNLDEEFIYEEENYLGDEEEFEDEDIEYLDEEEEY